MTASASDSLNPKYHMEDGKLSIQHMKRKGATAMPRPHSHASVELYYLLDGERVYFVDGQVVTVHKGELIMIAGHEIHATASSEVAEFERILINYDPAILPRALQTLELLLHGRGFRVFPLSLREQGETERLLNKMLDESRQEKPFYESYCLSLLAELIILLGRFENTASRSNPSRYSLHNKVSEIATYVREHYREAVTLEDTAKHFYLSSSYLSRIFHKLTGFRFREYIIHIRVREAQQLLGGSRQKIQEIALAVGFEHLSHFNKTFKKATGLTPMEYRKQAKNGQAPPHQPF
ncbi:AraC family transcriptional regulator [Paenibacillus sp. BIHB 4019]|uniref:AraC family transcriptional regulator n=1 Tax=Paenibacillus sp. BIHB 4019 TaxID=1870819 RepID=A0A1B2DJN7_9BACL|nr:AraC family transcriptional regulator [Paenibacillus sp. BIHB 4019]ANY67901.1 AraC family transcriptional regulator [Paenibacillus sp. BIHB 4019]